MVKMKLFTWYFTLEELPFFVYEKNKYKEVESVKVIIFHADRWVVAEGGEPSVNKYKSR
jgi:hypothetical protein